MPTPKSEVKTRKIGDKCFIEFTDSSARVEFQMFELTRAALRDVGKFLKTEWRAKYYSKFKKRTGSSSKAIKTVVYSNKNTIYPRLEIGLPIRPSKSAKKNPYYAFYQEFGSSKTPRLGLLTNAVKENVSAIRAIEAKYLDALNKGDEEVSQRILKTEGDIDED